MNETPIIIASTTPAWSAGSSEAVRVIKGTELNKSFLNINSEFVGYWFF
jgi:hypothetical protein